MLKFSSRTQPPPPPPPPTPPQLKQLSFLSYIDVLTASLRGMDSATYTRYHYLSLVLRCARYNFRVFPKPPSVTQFYVNIAYGYRGRFSCVCAVQITVWRRSRPPTSTQTASRTTRPPTCCCARASRTPPPTASATSPSDRQARLHGIREGGREEGREGREMKGAGDEWRGEVWDRDCSLLLVTAVDAQCLDVYYGDRFDCVLKDFRLLVLSLFFVLF